MHAFRNVIPLLALASTLITGPAFAQDEPASFAEAKALALTKADVVAVDCDAGETITEALRSDESPLRIWFVGRCVEEVVIERDDVLLRGFRGSSRLIGSLSTFGSLRLEIRGFEIRNAPASGIRISENSEALIRDMVILDSGFRGILLEDSVAEITDTTVRRNPTVGILNRGSHVTLSGRIISTEAGVAALSATLGATYFADPAEVQATNSFFGLIIQLNSSMTFAEGTLNASDNVAGGILVATEASVAHGTADFILENNGGPGLVIGEHATWTPFVGFGATISVKGNVGGGILAISSGIVNLLNGTSVTENMGPGMVMSGSSILSASDTVSTDNAGPNVVISSLSSASFGTGNDFGGPIVCSGVVDVSGEITCPSSANPAPAVSKQLDLIRQRAAAGLAIDFDRPLRQ